MLEMSKANVIKQESIHSYDDQGTSLYKQAKDDDIKANYEINKQFAHKIKVLSMSFVKYQTIKLIGNRCINFT